VDHQLAGAAVQLRPGHDGARSDRPVDPSGVRSPFTQLYVAQVQADGSMLVLLQSDSLEVLDLDGADLTVRRCRSEAEPFDAQSADVGALRLVVSVRAFRPW
jgi:hypothetical protein